MSQRASVAMGVERAKQFQHKQIYLALLQADVAPYTVLDIVDFLFASEVYLRDYAATSEWQHVDKIRLITNIQLRLRVSVVK